MWCRKEKRRRRLPRGPRAVAGESLIMAVILYADKQRNSVASAVFPRVPPRAARREDGLLSLAVGVLVFVLATHVHRGQVGAHVAVDLVDGGREALDEDVEAARLAARLLALRP